MFSELSIVNSMKKIQLQYIYNFCKLFSGFVEILIIICKLLNTLYIKYNYAL